MHIALLGGTGYVGNHFASEIKRRGAKLSVIGRSSCNLYDPNALKKEIVGLAPDFLINCAGYTGKPNVDACEIDKTNCLAGNAILPGIISEVCNDINLRWGHVSSGCIFTGRRADGAGFTEADQPNFSFRQNNCSFYSGTKALGEELIAEDPSCYIWRLRIPFSNIDSQRNFLSKLLRYKTLLEAENSLSELTEFAAAALDCFEYEVPFGTYNLTNPGSVFTSEAVDLIREYIKPNCDFRFFVSEEQFMEVAANAPRSNCVLDSSKAIGVGLKLTPVRDALRQALKNWQSE